MSEVKEMFFLFLLNVIANVLRNYLWANLKVLWDMFIYRYVHFESTYWLMNTQLIENTYKWFGRL